jgi:short-subunit dehydrogenase
MRARLKPLDRQVMVITGASSGIGLALARRAAAGGAAVVLNARSGDVLSRVANEIAADSGQALAVPGDIGDPATAAAVGEAAVQRFGRVDTWVNVAGVGVWGPAHQVSPADHERLFQTNYFGVVHGSLEAVRRLRPDGGALINIGSVLGDVASPMLGPYSASKHAVKGFTEALRMDLIGEGAPISVTLIKPSSISTPFPEHSKNLTGQAMRVPPPSYGPEAVVEAILHAAQHPIRQVTVGAGARPMVLATAAAPGLADRVFAALVPRLARSRAPMEPRDSLYAPFDGGQEQTPRYHGRKVSFYARAQMHSRLTLGVGLLAAGGAARLLVRMASGRRH